MIKLGMTMTPEVRAELDKVEKSIGTYFEKYLFAPDSAESTSQRVNMAISMIECAVPGVKIDRWHADEGKITLEMSGNSSALLIDTLGWDAINEMIVSGTFNFEIIRPKGEVIT